MSTIESRLVSAKAFVFDFLGTLVEIDRDAPSMWETLNRLGYNSSSQLLAIWESDAFDGCLTPAINGDPDYETWRVTNLLQFVRLSGVPVVLADGVLSMLLEMDKQITVKAVSRANPLLQLLRQNKKKIGLCSNWDYAIGPYLEQSRLPEFDGVSVSAEIGARKPNAAIFSDVCSKLDVCPGDAIFVGDNWSTDIVGAIRSELTPVWLRRGLAPRGVPHVIEFDELTDFEVWLRQLL